MSALAIGAVGFGVLLLMLVVRIPIGVAMLVVGMAGFAAVTNVTALLNILKTQLFYQFLNYELTVIPLFMLMGQFASKARLSQDLFHATNTWIGHYRGGMAMAAIGGCAGFGAICGSSLATAATMGHVALPELRRHGYSGSFATGVLAAGGTLGILIPPSVVLIVAAIVVEANIETLFQAAFIPGLIAVTGYMIAIVIFVRFFPDAGPSGVRASAQEKWRALVSIWPVIAIFLLVIGGIYFGLFTPTEGASVGAVSMGIVAVTRGRMRLQGLTEAVLETAVSTAMIFLILFAANVLNAFLGFTRMPMVLSDIISGSGLSPMMVLLLMVAIFVVLGMFMDSLSMILLFMPIFWPILMVMDFGMGVEDLKIWFSIITLMVVEMGLITPPVGLNVFVINSIAGDVPMRDSFRGVLPFLMSDVVRIGILILFPGLTLFLPHVLK